MSTPDLTQQLAELAQRVERLEDAQADTLTPAVFSLNAAGELEEQLSGKLTAKGIVFNVGTLTNATQSKPAEKEANEIVWNIEGTGETRSAITTYKYKAKLPSVAKGLVLSMAAISAGGALEAVVIAEIDEAANQAVIRVQAGAQTRTILRNVAKGSSDFLQLRTNPGLFLAKGEAEVTWPGGANASNLTTINWGIEEKPESFAWIFCQARWVGRVWFAGVLNPTVEHFQVQGYCPTELVAANVKEAFYWFAYLI